MFSPAPRSSRLRSSSPYSALTEHDGLFEGSAIIRSLAPGETARLWLTARAAGAAEGAFDVGLVGALLDTRAFLRFADGAADALRTALLDDPSLAAVEARKICSS
jgi:hypothetical protein